MATKKLPTAVLFIDSNRIDAYNFAKNIVVSLDFPQEIIRYTEILDREKLHMMVKSLIETNKITPSSLIVILAKNILFTKDFAKDQKTEEQLDLQAQEFIDNVPFESVGSKIVPLEKGIRVIAANADLYESIMSTFQQAGFSIQSLLPITLFGEDIQIERLTTESEKIFSQKSESLRKYSLVSDSGNFVAGKEEEVIKKKNNVMIIASVGMFAVAGFLVIFALFFLK
jgi:Tfp pilus assembly PilM family ATPase